MWRSWIRLCAIEKQMNELEVFKVRRKQVSHIETSQIIYKANQLTVFYKKRRFGDFTVNFEQKQCKFGVCLIGMRMSFENVYCQ